MSKTVGVLGLGVFGSSICKTLSNFDDVDIIAVDLDLKNIERIAPFVSQAAQGDITDKDVLKALGIDSCDVVIIATGSNLEASILAILNAKMLGVGSIIAKAKNKMYMNIFEKLGATKVIRPEKEMGERVARELMRNKIIDSIDLDDRYAVVEFYVPKNWVGSNLVTLDVRSQYKINIIGVRKSLHGSLDVSNLVNYQFQNGDIVVAIAESEHFERLDMLNKL